MTNRLTKKSLVAALVAILNQSWHYITFCSNLSSGAWHQTSCQPLHNWCNNAGRWVHRRVHLHLEGGGHVGLVCMLEIICMCATPRPPPPFLPPRHSLPSKEDLRRQWQIWGGRKAGFHPCTDNKAPQLDGFHKDLGPLWMCPLSPHCLFTSPSIIPIQCCSIN